MLMGRIYLSKSLVTLLVAPFQGNALGAMSSVQAVTHDLGHV